MERGVKEGENKRLVRVVRGRVQIMKDLLGPGKDFGFHSERSSRVTGGF